MKVLAQTGVAMAACFLGFLFYASFKVAPAPAGPALLAEHMMEALAPSAISTLGMIALCYVFQFMQSAAIWTALEQAKADAIRDKKPAPKRFDLKYGNTKYTRTVDRTVANMMEQMPCALVSTGLYALFVNAQLGSRLGWLWIFFRALYPHVYRRGPPMLFCSTMPGYFIVLYCVVGVAKQVI